MTEFTKGPWKLQAHDNYMGDNDVPPLEIVDCDGEIIACNTSYYPTELDAKYAHLIAAAPDLYEVLSDAVENNMQVENADWWGKALAALAKARGETQE